MTENKTTDGFPTEDRVAICETLKQSCERFGAEAIQEAMDDVVDAIEQETREIAPE